MNNKLLCGALLATGLATASVSADDLVSAGDALCEKIRSCTLAQFDSADMTPEMRQMVEPMVQNMCVSMRGQLQQVPDGHPLYEPSVQCMRSMADLSCADLEDPAKAETAACKALQEKAEAFAPKQ